jgi:hypothetical protein
MTRAQGRSATGGSPLFDAVVTALDTFNVQPLSNTLDEMRLTSIAMSDF